MYSVDLHGGASTQTVGAELRPHHPPRQQLIGARQHVHSACDPLPSLQFGPCPLDPGRLHHIILTWSRAMAPGVISAFPLYIPQSQPYTYSPNHHPIYPHIRHSVLCVTSAQKPPRLHRRSYLLSTHTHIGRDRSLNVRRIPISTVSTGQAYPTCTDHRHALTRTDESSHPPTPASVCVLPCY